MIFDNTLLFSDAQAITADAASTNILDLGATGTVYGATAALTRDDGKSVHIPLLIQVTEAFNNLTTLGIQIQVDDNSGFSSAKTIMTQTVALAQLAAGFTSAISCVPPGTNERYMRVFYDVTGTAPTTGKITAGVVHGVQTNGVSFS